MAQFQRFPFKLYMFEWLHKIALSLCLVHMLIPECVDFVSILVSASYFGAKPLSEPMLANCWFYSKDEPMLAYPPLQRCVCAGIILLSSLCPSVCPYVCLWTESCPLCVFNNTCQILFIFTHLIKQFQKVCRMYFFFSKLNKLKFWQIL